MNVGPCKFEGYYALLYLFTLWCCFMGQVINSFTILIFWVKILPQLSRRADKLNIIKPIQLTWHSLALCT